MTLIGQHAWWHLALIRAMLGARWVKVHQWLSEASQG